MPSITCTQAQRDNQTGRITLNFGKIGMEFNDIAHAKAFVESMLSRDTMIALFIKIATDRNLTLAQIEGKTLTINVNLANWGTFG